MANGFTNLPTSLLGAVSIGGALSVGGGLTVGASPNIVRVGNFTGYGPGVSGNLGFDAATRDNAGVTAALEALGANGNAQKLRRILAGGTALDIALAQFFGTDFTVHGYAANTLELTQYTKTLPANLLGANGGFVVEVAWKILTFTSGSIAMRIRLGGTQLTQLVGGSVGSGYTRLFVGNKNATNAQAVTGISTFAATTPSTVNATTALDTTANQDLTVTLQDTLGTNTAEVDLVSVGVANSFGPV